MIEWILLQVKHNTINYHVLDHRIFDTDRHHKGIVTCYQIVLWEIYRDKWLEYMLFSCFSWDCWTRVWRCCHRAVFHPVYQCWCLCCSVYNLPWCPLFSVSNQLMSCQSLIFPLLRFHSKTASSRALNLPTVFQCILKVHANCSFKTFSIDSSFF